ncbi:hypothetical protein HBH53_213410 [Parastagonospora nodorum]|nr:hypothetical protein HBH53_213410 [Parastagonospora nodorum]KAH3958211.1 hypothetical protein HBH51_212990 [Parastagonospora nodorum]KAH5003495.1 hypothetical protein HBI74_231910 [Parastagonospora nodorum]KAH5341729.1 hypothetical protein HBI48_230070 [Parastagonospora nodorum]KAH5588416.1 hypothetical protein HBI45_225910 [Parastagonospora nodorum]
MISTSRVFPMPRDIETRLFINGSFVPSCRRETFAVINPATEQEVARVYEADASDVDLAVDAAEAAFPAWSDLGGFERARFFYRLADALELANSDLAALEAISMGRPVGQYREAINGAALLRYYAGKCTDVQGDSSLQTSGFVNVVLRQPFGVCAGITPWNAPITMMLFKIAGACVCGNTIICKSSEKAPLTALYLAKLIKQAGFPPGVINILSGKGTPCGDALARHPRIRKISLTGSINAGRAVKKAAAESNLKNVSLELGGKSPLIIFEDADLDKAIPAAARSIISNTGQVCIASSRLLVQSSILKTFSTRLVAEIEATGYNPESSQGNPLSPETLRGPQADLKQYDSIIGFLQESKAAGHEVLTGGGRDTRHGKKGFFVQPTLILNPGDQSRISREEIFGPVQVLATFQTEEDAIRRSIDSEYGLYASIYTRYGPSFRGPDTLVILQ